MPTYKQPTFQERTALAAKAKQTALDKLRAKPPVDPAVLAERREAAALRDAEQAKVRAEKLAARELEQAARKERALQNAEPVRPAAPVKTEQEQKEERDARYAARKNRAGKR